MNPLNLLLAMYAGFAALLFTSGYIYKTNRDRRNKEREEREQLQHKLNFDQKVEESKAQRQHTLVAR